MFLAFLAYVARDVAKSKMYSVVEIVFGMVIAAQGAVFSDVSKNQLADIIAFVAGVRIAIDGVKRFFEFGAYRLFSLTAIRYNWRNFKRWSRRMTIKGN